MAASESCSQLPFHDPEIDVALAQWFHQVIPGLATGNHDVSFRLGLWESKNESLNSWRLQETISPKIDRHRCHIASAPPPWINC